jgi:hypothetical protein
VPTNDAADSLIEFIHLFLQFEVLMFHFTTSKPTDLSIQKPVNGSMEMLVL